jgi:hypothetical protein
MYFEMKSTLKSNYYHTPKHTERNRLDVPKTEIGSTAKKKCWKTLRHVNSSIAIMFV